MRIQKCFQASFTNIMNLVNPGKFPQIYPIFRFNIDLSSF